jgi:hypothetical protein
MSRFACTIIIIAFAGMAAAQPQIAEVSGTLDPGATVQIYGSGFGDKERGAPILWDDLNFGSYGNLHDGDPIPTQNGAYGHGGDPDAPHLSADSSTYEASTVYRRDGRVSQRPVYAVTKDYGWLGPLEEINGRSFYLDWWVRGAESTRQSGPGNKILRIQAGPDLSTGGIILYEVMVTYPLGSDAEVSGNGYSKLFTAGDDWTHLALWLDVSGGGGEGTLRVWSNGELIHSIEDLAGQEQGFPRITALGLQPTQGTEPGGEFQFGDIYLDNTLARVMIGNAASWESVTHHEMQIPVTWEADKISFTVNQGSFSDQDALYLYISDSVGNINENGHPVTVEFVDPELPGKPGQPGQPVISQ